MTTEREYREWRRRKHRRDYTQRQLHRKGKALIRWLCIFIAVMFIAVVVKHNRQLFSFSQLEQKTSSLDVKDFDLKDWFHLIKLSANSLESLTQEFVTEIDEPIVIGDEYNILEGNFTYIDRQALKVQYHGNSVSELAEILSQYAHTDAEKARIIYRWITHNITYDVAALSDLFNRNIYPDVTTQAVLTDRSTICSGYANLYQQLAQQMGLKSLIILGYAKGVNYAVGNNNEINHAWNGVQIEGKWYLVDATWGAGTIKNNVFQPEFNPHYFATHPQEFIYSHFPKNPQWQLVNFPYARNQFDSLAHVSDNLFKHDIELVSHQNYSIYTDGRVNITLKVPQNVVAIAKLESKDGNHLSDNYTLVQKQNNYININAAFPRKGNYKLDIFAKPEDNNNSYPLVVRYQVLASQSGTKFPKVFQHFVENNGYLESPLSQQLLPNQNVFFNLRVNQALDVKVINQSTNQWTTLRRYGNLYTGNVDVGKGKIVVFGKFPGDSRYWALLEYN